MQQKRIHEPKPPTSDRARRDFPAKDRYTLEPLRHQGPRSLAFSDVDGIEAVTLKEIRFLWGGPENELEIRKSDDIFQSLRDRGRTFPSKPAIVRASFLVKLAGAPAPRMVSIRRAAALEPARDESWPIIETWLRKRGFVEEGGVDDPAAVASVGRG